MKTRRLALTLALILAGCQLPPATSSPIPVGSPVPASIGPDLATPASVAVAELEAVVASMERAVVAGDRDGYLALVDLSDPVFATEHGRWADEWAGAHPVAEYSLRVSDVRVDGALATGTLTVTWSVEDDPSGEGVRTASFAARFTRGDQGRWRYAGEAWLTTEIPRFIIRVAPGLEATARQIAEELPGIYDDVTAALGDEPAGTLQIKLYADSLAIVANTLLSLPGIAGWNEPGEALKLVDQGDGLSLAPTIAHELTHFIGFDRAGTRRSRMPWWLDEGIATYVGSQVSGIPEDDRLAQVKAWAADGRLAPWAEMGVFEETPLELWPFVYSQGYAMVRFVTEEIGIGQRNAWLAAMATEMDIDEATDTVLGRSFDQLDREFRAWLAATR